LSLKNTADQRIFTAESDKATWTESEPTKMVMCQGMMYTTWHRDLKELAGYMQTNVAATIVKQQGEAKVA